MLQHLSIQNYTLIQELEIDLSKGFSVITGETGAGKSILLGALSLILGQRADAKVLSDTNKKCIIEGRFDIADFNLQQWFEDHDLDYEDEIYIRREITKQGKSRGFINDTPATLPLLSSLGDKLVNIHSQHNTITLNKSDFQKQIIDNIAGIGDKLVRYKELFKNYKQMQKYLEALKEQDKSAKADFDYFSFQFNELDEANLQKDEQSELENELQLLSNTESIKSVFFELSHCIINSEESMLSQLSHLSSELHKVGNSYAQAGDYGDRIDSVLIELQDIASEVESVQDRLEVNPERLQIIEERLNLIYTLQQKHRVQSIAELLTIKQELEDKIQSVSNIEDQIVDTEKKLADLKAKLETQAAALSAKRKKTAKNIEKQLLDVCAEMGMENAAFEVHFEKAKELSQDGFDQIVFLFNANKGAALNPLSKVASGGELSRLMLGLKSLVFRNELLPTVIFDEIDTGVSGDIAGKVGDIMRKMSEKMQVLAITHLPQIAGKSDHHFFVYKNVENDKTISRIKKLTADERIDEIAKMLSNNEVSDVAKLAAKELLK